MGDRERGKGKLKVLPDVESDEWPDGSARRTRPRTTEGPGGQNGADDGNPILPLPDLNLPGPQQQPSMQGSRDEDVVPEAVRLRRVELWTQDPEVLGCFWATLRASLAMSRASGGVGNPVAGALMTAPQAGTPSSSSQMNFARNNGMTGAHLAATMVPQHRPQAPSPSHYLLQGQGLPMQVPSSGAQAGNTSSDHAYGRGFQMQAPAPAITGQPGAATRALGSGQPQPPEEGGRGDLSWMENPEIIRRVMAALHAAQHLERGGVGSQGRCLPDSATGASGFDQPQHQANVVVHNNADPCQFHGREAGNLAIAHRQHQRPPPDQQGLPPARTNHGALVALQRYIMPEYQHFLHVPGDGRCPACRSRPAWVAPDPWRHCCLCDVCHGSRRCPWCFKNMPSILRLRRSRRL